MEIEIERGGEVGDRDKEGGVEAGDGDRGVEVGDRERERGVQVGGREGGLKYRWRISLDDKMNLKGLRN